VLPNVLQSRLRHAVGAVVPDFKPSQVQVRPATDPKFGDYQSNSLMIVAREQRANPRQLAVEVLKHLKLDDLCEPVEIAGAGFLNFRLKPAAMASALSDAAVGDTLFVTPSESPRTIVIDFSSPNVAKPMHVGHIRSTVLGDSLVRILRRLGHRVVSDNHIGDWGTQFGMLLVGWKTLLDREALSSDPLKEMERIYKAINAACDPKKETYQSSVHERAKAELVRLQSGDSENLAIWKEMIRLSQQQFDSIYGRLGVRFDFALGESFYNPWLPGVVLDLVKSGAARESRGAYGIFSDGSVPAKDDPFLIQQDGEWRDNPFLIQKSDGGYNYATTDLATLQYRISQWSPQDVLYVTDGRQQLHFKQLFTAFQRWKPDAAGAVRLHHVWFGSILGADGKPLKTRSGENVRLAELLDEAEERAFQVVGEKRPDLAVEIRREIARVVGIGAVKWQDLLPNRQSDYVFSWEKMLALTGNTAVYVQYQRTRARKVVRDAGSFSTAITTMSLETPSELALARQLLNFGLTLEGVAEEFRPNYLCNYLFELASLYSRFYENCPVLKAEEPLRSSRVTLCDLTARVLGHGLELLGIESPEMM
jgi:arginyl-tRNA synthetase